MQLPCCVQAFCCCLRPQQEDEHEPEGDTAASPRHRNTTPRPVDSYRRGVFDPSALIGSAPKCPSPTTLSTWLARPSPVTGCNCVLLPRRVKLWLPAASVFRSFEASSSRSSLWRRVSSTGRSRSMDSSEPFRPSLTMRCSDVLLDTALPPTPGPDPSQALSTWLAQPVMLSTTSPVCLAVTAPASSSSLVPLLPACPPPHHEKPDQDKQHAGTTNVELVKDESGEAEQDLSDLLDAGRMERAVSWRWGSSSRRVLPLILESVSPVPEEEDDEDGPGLEGPMDQALEALEEDGAGPAIEQAEEGPAEEGEEQAEPLRAEQLLVRHEEEDGQLANTEAAWLSEDETFDLALQLSSDQGRVHGPALAHEREVGQGFFGCVLHVGPRQGYEEDYALKTTHLGRLYRSFFVDGEDRGDVDHRAFWRHFARVQSEATLLAKLSRAHVEDGLPFRFVVLQVAWGWQGPLVYSLQELAVHGDLHRFELRVESEAAVLWVFKHLLLALQWLLSHGVLHCDVKPENVLLGGDLRPRLADFNLAVELSMLPEGAVWEAGTTDYLAPEVDQGLPLPRDGRADMYSLGVLVRQLLGDELRRREEEFGGLLSDLIGFATRPHLEGRQARYTAQCLLTFLPDHISDTSTVPPCWQQLVLAEGPVLQDAAEQAGLSSSSASPSSLAADRPPSHSQHSQPATVRQDSSQPRPPKVDCW